MRLPDFIYKRIKNKNTSLGDNLALPPEEDCTFEYRIVKKRFNEVCEAFSEWFQDIALSNIDTIVSMLNERLTKCQELEKPIRKQLENLCENTVVNLLQVPQETIIFHCKLVDHIQPKHELNITPNDVSKRDFDFNDLTDYENVNKVILKKRFLNALIQGASYTYALFDHDLVGEIKKMNKDLPQLYYEINLLNDLLLFLKEEHITDDHKPQGACVEVMINGGNEKTEILTQGLIFPLLLQESLKGFFELFISHGLPQDNRKANYIINQADFLLAEPWDQRIGVGLWQHLVNDDLTPQISPYFFMMISNTPVDEFNAKMREMLAKTTLGKKYFQEFKNECLHDYEMNSLVATIALKNDEENILNDSYISAEELDDMVIEEEGLVNTDLVSLCKNTDEYKWNVKVGDKYASSLYRCVVIVDNQEIPTELINLRVEVLSLGGYECYHLHIHIDPILRHQGCALKTYKAFIRKYGHAVTLFDNRSNAAFEDGVKNRIEQTWQSLSNDPHIQVGPITDNDNQTIGYIATWGVDDKVSLTEGATPLLYHFCSIESLQKMLQEDKMWLNGNEASYNGSYDNFASFTRNKNSKQGYPYMQSRYSGGGGTSYNPGSAWMMCRIEFDGNVMNTYNQFKDDQKQSYHFKVKPFDYIYNLNKEEGESNLNGKEEHMSYLNTDADEELYRQPFSQAEDRLVSDADYIPNIKKYINRVDILIESNWLFEEMHNVDYDPHFIEECKNDILIIKRLYENANGLIKLFATQDTFDHQTREMDSQYCDMLVYQLSAFLNENLTIGLPLLNEDKGISREVMSMVDMIFNQIKERFEKEEYQVDINDGYCKALEINFEEPIFGVVKRVLCKILLCQGKTEEEVYTFIQKNRLEGGFNKDPRNMDIRLRTFAFEDRLPMLFTKQMLAHELEHAWQYGQKIGKKKRKTKYSDLGSKGAIGSNSDNAHVKKIGEILYFFSKNELDSFIHSAYSELETLYYASRNVDITYTPTYATFMNEKNNVNDIVNSLNNESVVNVLKSYGLSQGDFKRYIQRMVRYVERKFKQIQERFNIDKRKQLELQKENLDQMVKIKPDYLKMLML